MKCKWKRLLAGILVLAMIAATLPAMEMGALAADYGSYISYTANAQGNLTQSNPVIPASAVPVTSSTITLENNRWYVVNATVNISSRITVSGTAHLILMDGKTLNAKAGITVANGNTLNIYGQANDTGTLNASITESKAEAAAIGGIDRGQAGGTVTIHGGIINAINDGYGAGIGGGAGYSSKSGGNGCTLTINGGTVTAKSNGNCGAGIGGGGYLWNIGGTGTGGAGGTLTINGGNVTAISTGYGAGIGGGGAPNSRTTGGAGSTVTINGGIVSVIGGSNARAIGGGGGKAGANNGSLSLGEDVIFMGGASATTLSDAANKDNFAEYKYIYITKEEPTYKRKESADLADGKLIITSKLSASDCGAYFAYDMSVDGDEEEGYVATYCKHTADSKIDENAMDFDIYRWKDEDMENVFSYAVKEAGENEVKGKLINGVPASYYYADEEFEEASYHTLTVTYDDGDYLAQLVFWMNDTSEASKNEAWAIANKVVTSGTQVSPAEKTRLGDTCFYLDPAIDGNTMYEGNERFYGDPEVDVTALDQVAYFYSLDEDYDYDVYAWDEEPETTLADVVEEEMAEYPDNVAHAISPEVLAAYKQQYDITVDFAGYYEKYTDEETNESTYITTLIAQNGIQFVELVIYLEPEEAAATLGGLTIEHDFENVEGKVVCKYCGEVQPKEFMTKLTFTKNYTDLFDGTKQVENISEQVNFKLTPMAGQSNAPAFAPDGYTVAVTNGMAEVSIPLPDMTTFGEFWYELTETAGNTAGVVYNSQTYYVHLIAAYMEGELGIVSATIHKTAPTEQQPWNEYPEDTEDDKIDTITNQYGKGDLVIHQVVDGNDAEGTDEFTTTIILNAKSKTVVGNITCGDQTITPDNWGSDGTCTIEVKLTGGSSVTIKDIPANVTYTVEQTVTLAELGYEGPAYELSDNELTFDHYVEDDNNVIGSITDPKDTVTITNTKNSPIDVGVMLESGTFIAMGIGAAAVMAFLFLSRNKRYEGE